MIGANGESEPLPRTLAWDTDARIEAVWKMQESLNKQGVRGCPFHVCEEALYQAIEAYNAALSGSKGPSPE